MSVDRSARRSNNDTLCRTCTGNKHFVSTCHPLYSSPFLPRDAMLARYMLSSFVRLSVRPSVTSQHCTKTAKRGITQTTPYYSPGFPVFCRQRSRRNSDGVTPTRASNRANEDSIYCARASNRSAGVGSNWRFSTNISL